MARKRKDLDIGGEKDKKSNIVPFDKKKGGFQEGQSGNPDGKAVGTMSGATRMTNKIKEGLIQSFQSSMAPSMLRAMLDGKIPEQFLPADLKQRIKEGKPIEKDEDEILVRQAFSSWKWAMDWMAKMFPKTLGIFGSVHHDHTIASMVKDASTQPKTQKVIDMVEKKTVDEVTEFSALDDDGEEDD